MAESTTIPIQPMTKKLMIALRTHPKFNNINESWDKFLVGLVEYFEKKYDFWIDRGILERDNSYRFKMVKDAMRSRKDYFKDRKAKDEYDFQHFGV